jgi:hypothetical protein
VEHVNRGRDTPIFCPTLQVLDMSILGDAAVINPVIKFLSHVLQHLAVDSSDCLHDPINYVAYGARTWGGHIEHLYGRTETWSVCPSVGMPPSA